MVLYYVILQGAALPLSTSLLACGKDSQFLDGGLRRGEHRHTLPTEQRNMQREGHEEFSDKVSGLRDLGRNL